MDISQTIQALDQTAIVLGISPRIHIQGFTSPDGGNEVNKNLSALRAKAVRNELANGSFRAISFRAGGMGSDALQALFSSDQAALQGRQVAFRVVRAPGNILESRK